MDKAEWTALRRQVGSMTYAQVRPLFDENRKQITLHDEKHCPDRKTRRHVEYEYCPDLQSFSTESEGLRHKQTCVRCTRIVRDIECVVEYCAVWNELSRRKDLYSRRLVALDRQERERLFVLEHDRLPESINELIHWESGLHMNAIEINAQRLAMIDNPYPEHGLTGRKYRETYDRFFARQGGRCAVCERRIGENWRWESKITHLVIDHSHSTGAIRGLLCSQCNTHVDNVEKGRQEMMGRMGEPVPDYVEKIVAYLERHIERHIL